MKYLIISALLLASTPVLAQFTPPPVDSASGKIAYATIIQVPGATKAQLYGRALKWLSTVEARTTNAPPVTDAASGILAADAGLPFTARAVDGAMQATLWRKLSVTVKDGKARFECASFTVQPYVASAAAFSPPSAAQLKLTPAEEYLDRDNARYYTKQGEPKAYVRSVLGAIHDQTTTEIASLRAALLKSDDF